MEIYNKITSPASEKFEKLLKSQLSKEKIEEGKIVDGKITKITEKYIFLFIQGNGFWRYSKRGHVMGYISR